MIRGSELRCTILLRQIIHKGQNSHFFSFRFFVEVRSPSPPDDAGSWELDLTREKEGRDAKCGAVNDATIWFVCSVGTAGTSMKWKKKKEKQIKTR